MIKYELKLINHYPFKPNRQSNIMMLTYTCFISQKVAKNIEIQTMGIRVIKDDKQKERFVIVMVDSSLNDQENVIFVPLSILKYFEQSKQAVQIIRKPLELIHSFLPKLNIAKQIKIYFNESFIQDPLFTTCISNQDFICQTGQCFIDSTWLQSYLKKAKSQKIKLQWTLYMKENQKERYKTYYRIYIEVQNNQSLPFLFKKGATTLTIKSQALHSFNKYRTIRLSDIQKYIFSMDAYRHVEESLNCDARSQKDNSLIFLQSDKNINLDVFFHYLAQQIISINYLHINCEKISSTKQFWSQFNKLSLYQNSLILIRNIYWLQQIYQSQQLLHIKIKDIIKMIEKQYQTIISSSLRHYQIVIQYQGKVLSEDMVVNVKKIQLKLSREQKKQCFRCLMDDKAKDHGLKDQIVEIYYDKFGWQILAQFLENKWSNIEDKEKHIIFGQFNQILKQEKVQNLIQVSWDDVGGLQVAKEEIKETILLPIKHPQIFDEWIKPRTGLLFYGPPGTGKTLLGKCIAKQCKMSFISVKGPQLLNMYVGESEKNVRQIFQRANAVKPCIVFMDELDALIPKRGNSGDSNQVMDRIVAELLMQMDLASSNQIFIIGATNRPDLLDPSILRPGRFDKQIYLGITKQKQDRIKILKAQTRHLTLDQNFNWELLLQKIPQNFTGADFYGLTSKAVMAAAERTISQSENGIKHEKIQISEQDFLVASALIKPSVTEADLSRYQQLKKIYS